MRPRIPGGITVTWLRGININIEFIQEKFGKDRFYCLAVLFFPHNEQPAASILIIVLAILPPAYKGVKPYMNLLPWDSLKALHNPSGIRLAVHEVTRWGMGQAQMRRVGQLFAEVLLGSRRPDQVCPEVVALKSEFDTIQYCFN